MYISNRTSETVQLTVQSRHGFAVKEQFSITLECSSQANPPVTQVTWMKTADVKNEFPKISKSLTIRFASPSDSGQYSCEATNEIGTRRSQPVQVNVICELKDALVVRQYITQYTVKTNCILLMIIFFANYF
uniref:Ig-like domain-containing protein n=1 Tax=Echeneis naucrates TaxID=173247 RepID=A0A665UUM7_ECHNA